MGKLERNVESCSNCNRCKGKIEGGKVQYDCYFGALIIPILDVANDYCGHIDKIIK